MKNISRRAWLRVAGFFAFTGLAAASHRAESDVPRVEAEPLREPLLDGQIKELAVSVDYINKEIALKLDAKLVYEQNLEMWLPDGSVIAVSPDFVANRVVDAIVTELKNLELLLEGNKPCVLRV